MRDKEENQDTEEEEEEEENDVSEMPGHHASPAPTAAGASVDASAGGCAFPPGMQSSFGEATDPRTAIQSEKVRSNGGQSPLYLGYSSVCQRANHFLEELLYQLIHYLNFAGRFL